MERVGILMSTYNGELFLEEQIDSILNQQGVEIDLFIRDDGSTDRTRFLLERYAEIDKRIHLFYGENIGVGNSFMDLLYQVPNQYDYYGFSDQDDIWDRNKIKSAVNALMESGCSLYASNQECIDKDGNTLYMRYSEDKKMNLTPISIMCKNTIAGCTFVFNKELFSLLKSRRPSALLLQSRIHDVWVAMSAAVTGSIFYDRSSFIKYRQHENNVVGATKDTKFDVLKMQFKKLKNASQRNGRSMIAHEVSNCFSEYISGSDFLRICGNPKPLKNKIEIIKNAQKIRSYTGESQIGFITKVIVGVF